MISQTQTIYVRLIKSSSWWIEVPVLIGCNLLLVASAYVSIDIPFSPVPITGQTFGVLLIAMALGSTRAVAVVTGYLLEGACGLPVFAGGAFGAHHLIGPTGGYLIGFVGAAYVVGFLANSGWDKSYLRSIVAMTTGHAIIFACGLAWLAKYVPDEILLASGLTPFIAGTIIKTALAAICLPTVWKFVKKH